MLKTDLREKKTNFTINILHLGIGDETSISTAEKILLIPDVVKNAITVNQVEKQLDGRLKYWYVMNGIRYTIIIAEFDEIKNKRKGEYLFSFFTDRRPNINGEILKQKEVKKKELFLRYNTKTNNSKLSGLPTDFSMDLTDNNTT